ncbi:hypothetical protein [Deinococcus sp. ME38]|uniref:hypothetical protein n=1 Tax=Deinococcus sp. ME38 TaxID=3400344 RepID=UPI003B59E057
MAGENRYVLRKLDNSTYTLPADAKVTSGDGETLQYRLIRAVESDDWEEAGDGRAVPTPLVLVCTIEASTEAAASAEATALWEFAKAARRLERDGRVYRPYRVPLSFVTVHQAGDLHTCTLTLLPSGSKWRSITDDTPRLF